MQYIMYWRHHTTQGAAPCFFLAGRGGELSPQGFEGAVQHPAAKRLCAEQCSCFGFADDLLHICAWHVQQLVRCQTMRDCSCTAVMQFYSSCRAKSSFRALSNWKDHPLSCLLLTFQAKEQKCLMSHHGIVSNLIKVVSCSRFSWSAYISFAVYLCLTADLDSPLTCQMLESLWVQACTGDINAPCIVA